MPMVNNETPENNDIESMIVFNTSSKNKLQ
jgi:hypothetical protein